MPLTFPSARESHYSSTVIARPVATVRTGRAEEPVFQRRRTGLGGAQMGSARGGIVVMLRASVPRGVGLAKRAVRQVTGGVGRGGREEGRGGGAVAVRCWPPVGLMLGYVGPSPSQCCHCHTTHPVPLITPSPRVSSPPLTMAAIPDYLGTDRRGRRPHDAPDLPPGGD